MRLEPYQETDFIAFVELLNALAAELGGQTTDEAAQLEYEAWLNRDLRQNRVVVRNPANPATLIAYADLFVTEKAEANLALGVHPDWRESGLEFKLLEWLTRRSRALSANAQNVLVPASEEQTGAFLEKNGFAVAGAYQKMVLEPLTSKSLDKARPLPASYTLKSYHNAGDDQLFIAAMNRSFSDLWGHGVATEAVWQQILELSDPEHFFVLLAEDEAVGFLNISVTDGDTTAGKLDSPGIAPEHRSPDLYRALALEGLQRLVAKGVERVTLECWGESKETVEAYEALGFTSVTVELGYQRRLNE